MKIQKLYESAKDTDKRLTSLAPDQRIGKAETWIPNCLNLNTNKSYQTFDGFGGALTEASAYVLSRMSEKLRKEVIQAYFDPDKGNAYCLARIHMNSCDFSLDNWACLSKKDLSLKSFSMEQTDKYITPLIQDVQKISEKASSDLKILLSPWSPPAWMKDNKDMNNGGHLLPEYKELWAQYFVTFIKKMKERGVNIDYVSIQNEPAAVQRWDSCVFSAYDEGEFAGQYLGPALEKAGLSDTKIYIWDHNRDLALERLEESLKVPGASKYIAGLAYHWYSGDQFDNIKAIYKKYPNIDLMFSEGCVEGGPRPGAWFTGERYAHNIINDLKSGTSKWIDWNIVLDMQGGPNHVGNYCHAPILADEKESLIHYQPSYYYIGHFSRFIKPGAKRLDAEFTSQMLPASVSGHLSDEIECLAFKNPDNSLVLVLTNRTEDKVDFELKCDQKIENYSDKGLILNCPARAIQTWLLQ